jgi:hypothetical protein
MCSRRITVQIATQEVDQDERADEQWNQVPHVDAPNTDDINAKRFLATSVPQLRRVEPKIFTLLT